MNIVVLSGRMYNGVVYGYTDDARQERSCFRGRLNFRMPNGKYDWIDTVCWRDNPNSEENGLVGWLEQHYLAPEDEGAGYGGKAIEVIGWLRPVEKQKTVTVKTKTGKKVDIPGVKYMTFELVIDQANFPPLSHGENGKDGVEIDDDLDFEDGLSVAEDDDEDIDEEVTPRRNSKSSGKTASASSRASKTATKKTASAKGRSRDDDDDSFFVED